MIITPVTAESLAAEGITIPDLTATSASTTTSRAKGSAPAPAPRNFNSGLINAADLAEMEVVPRPLLLGSWMKQGDLGYLYAPRGAGKSWMAMEIGHVVAEHLTLGDWAAGEISSEVYYFDAEMNLPDLQERALMMGIKSTHFHWLSNELLFNRDGVGVNIADPADQQVLSDMLPDGGMLIIDNLSTAQLGMDENDNDDFDLIRNWLLKLRHRKITVIIVHHAGRSGLMRGASRREDIAHWIIALKSVANDPGETVFTTSFEKCRNCKYHLAPSLRWTLMETDGRMRLVCEAHSGPMVMLGHIREGVHRASELATLLDVQPGTVSKWAKRLQDLGHIAIQNREYQALG